VPEIRPFRALRYRLDQVGDLADVISPPYDVISPTEQRDLLARHPANVVRLDLPSVDPGEEPDERYRRAARTLAGWRSDGTLHKDPRPSIYVYEQTYTVPGTGEERSQRGFFARLRLESYGAGSGVLPHERTFPEPREDRYRLLRATGVNTSPVVVMYADRSGVAAASLATATASAPEVDASGPDGVRHRLWVVPSDYAGGLAGGLVAAAGAGPITIADGHHRYETALRYRDERRMTRSCDEDPPFDYVLVLLLDITAERLTVLPTHRLLRDVGADSLARLRAALGDLFDVRDGVAREDLVRSFEGAPGAGGRGRFGLWARDGGALLDARRDSLAPLVPPGGDAVRRLDVTLLGAALELLVAREGARLDDLLGFSKSAAAAMGEVDAGHADAVFLLEPTPVESVTEVAAAGDVMPQKSTYFYPKAASGLVINPHEW